ncbi:MAG TPA: 4'-phosphopantetheinyl transferase superfamily protein [Solirubrobacteraceae bacterium]|nr:4'-phosphopantetheinyl transferase superfamily protein [Solirubrobacteraceae bacterium]
MVGRAVLRVLAAEALGAARPQEVTVAETADGKPFLPDSPDVRISVAHSETVVVVAACRQADIGVDVDSLGHVTPNVHRLAARVLAGDEFARLAEMEPAAAGVEFMRHWIVKEAVGKALGTGYVPALRGAELEPEPPGDTAPGLDGGSTRLGLRLKSVWAGPPAEDWTLHALNIPGADELIVVAIAAPRVALAPPLLITAAVLQAGGFAPRF